jgi:hypothetical protein
MSRSIIRLFNKKKFFYKNESEFSIFIKSILLVTTVSTHFTYAISTNKKEQTTVEKKYTMTRNGFTEFMIIDDKGRHFNVNNSLWYWKWNSIEDWHNIKEGNEIKFGYYGWRVPVLGLFPNIYVSDIYSTSKLIKVEV